MKALVYRFQVVNVCGQLSGVIRFYDHNRLVWSSGYRLYHETLLEELVEEYKARQRRLDMEA